MLLSTWRLSLALMAACSLARAQLYEFDWDKIEPNPNLEYHDCYDTFKCARFEVPLDWLAANNGTRNSTIDGRTAAIAVVKLPAVVPTNHSTYGGPIFFNPGGPGGSGVQAQLSIGPVMQARLDKPGVRHYDIVSFDPRGVGFSTPAINCYPGDTLSRSLTYLEMRPTISSRLGLFESFPYTIALAKAAGQRCKGIEILPYVNTPSVARDLVAMIDKSDRRFDAQRIEGSQARLHYIGFSYGTVLGNMFAGLFPGRVGRIALDGVVDAYDYTSGQGWVKALVSTDDMYDTFFEGCYNAAENCTLFRETDDSAGDIRARVDDLIRQLDEAPQVAHVPAAVRNETGMNIVLTGVDIRTMFGNAFYTAIYMYRQMATGLAAAIDHGDMSELVPMARQPTIPSNCDAPSGLPPDDRLIGAIDEQGLAVRCSDMDDVRNRTIDEWREYVEGMMEQSHIFGQAWASGQIRCAGWPARPNWNFDGPFTTPEADPEGKHPGAPLAPILFLNNRFDPVTPLQAARDMSEGHPGSRIVIVETEGHIASVSAPSRCRDALAREYFDTGALPEDHETICEVECGPWDEGCSLYTDLDEETTMMAARAGSLLL